MLSVDATLEMIAYDTAHHVSVVVTPVQAALGKQHIVDQAAPRAGEPAGQRNGEADFAPVDRLLGDVALGEALEHDLGAQPADLQVLRQARGELDQLVVEERHASLDAGCHAHAIALHQDVVHQSGVNVAIKEAIEGAIAVAGIDDLAERFRQSAVTDFASHRV